METRLKQMLFILSLTLILTIAMPIENSASRENKKLCALTFDDGPSADPELTSLVLDKLDKYHVKATFFLVGKNLNDSTKPVTDRMVKNGHEIGNHSWTYDDMAKISFDEVIKSVSDTSEAIKKYTGLTPAFFRPPNLSTSSIMYTAIDLPFVSGVTAGDWPGGGGDTIEHIMDKLKPGLRDGVIILLHDVQPKPHPTPDSLDTLIPYLIKEGYGFETLSELFKRKGVVPDSTVENMYVYIE
jgi:peptidoglycan/xylan/chitin deacetylase (PgdA/CDA1 family)